MAGDLVKFLRERLDEDEAKRWAVHDVAKCDALLYEELPADAPLPDADACECGYPARVLAEVAAKRAILEMHSETHECPSEYDNCGWFEFENGAICPTLRHVAAVYSGHPGYRPEWAPGQQYQAARNDS